MTAKPAPSALLQKIADAASSGNRLLARRELQSAIEATPDEPAVWLWQAWTAGTPAESETALKRAADLCPGDKMIDAGLIWFEGLQRLAAERGRREGQQPESDPRPESVEEDELLATLADIRDLVFASLYADDEKPFASEVAAASESDDEPHKHDAVC